MVSFLIRMALIGFLAHNPTLKGVGLTRQTEPVKYAIKESTDLDEYRCFLGVPYGYGWLIGKEVYFYSYDSKKSYKMLVTDVEAREHFPHMINNRLIGDTNCTFLVHHKGVLYLVKKTGRELSSHNKVWRSHESIEYDRKYGI